MPIAATPKTRTENLASGPSPAVLSLGLVVLTLVAFAPACWNGFVEYDDPEYVTANSHVLTGLTVENITWAVTATDIVAWHPLAWWSLQLDAELFGPNPAGYHATSILLHAAAVVVLFHALRRMTGAVWPSAVAAAVFAVHPLRVESVVWVAERKDVLATLCGALALLAYDRYARAPSPRRYSLVALALAVGLLAKPTLVTLPFALLLLDYWPLGRFGHTSARRLVLEKVPLVALAVGGVLLTLRAQSLAVRTFDQFPLDIRIGNAFLAYVQYLDMFVRPVGLAAFYPHPRVGPFQPVAILAGVALVAITGLAVWQRRQRPYLLVGWLWYLGMMVPMIGLVQVGGHGRADRYTYLPLVGITVAVVWGFAELADRYHAARTPIRVLGAVVVGLLALATRAQVGHWRDTDTLWRHAAAATTDNYIAHRNLAIELDRRGESNEALKQYELALPIYPTKQAVHNDIGAFWLRRGNVGKALDQFRESLKVAPDDAVTHQNLGSALVRAGDAEAALPHLRTAVERLPTLANAHFNLALACAGLGRIEEAKRHFADGIALDPKNADAHHWFGNALRDRGDPACVGYLQSAAELRPTDPDVLYDLGLALQSQKQYPAALGRFRQAVGLQPGGVKFYCALGHATYEAGDRPTALGFYRAAGRIDPRWPAQWDQQAWRLAVYPEAKVRNGVAAVRLAEQACQATEEKEPGFLDTLAAAYAEVGRFDAAVDAAKKAIAGANPILAGEIRERLKLYEARKPFRGIVDPTGGW